MNEPKRKDVGLRTDKTKMTLYFFNRLAVALALPNSLSSLSSTRERRRVSRRTKRSCKTRGCLFNKGCCLIKGVVLHRVRFLEDFCPK